MRKPSKISIRITIIILKLLTNTADTLNMRTDLEIICGFVSGTDFVNKPPQECTSLAVPNKNIDHLNAVKSIKGNLSLLLIDDTNTYYTWPDVVKKGASAYLSDVKSLGVNYIVFANTYKSQDDMTEERANFSQNLQTFIIDAKKQYPEVAFGLVLTAYIDWLKESLDIGLLKDYVDFFMLNSMAYVFCEYQNHQAKMNTLATKDDIIGSIQELKKLGVNPAELIYSIDLVVQSVKSDILGINFDHEDMSYSRLCSKKMSKRRKYCFSTIQNLFEKARVHITELTLGIYINGVDDDDFDGNCGCTTKDDTSAMFRGLKTIAGASREDKNDVSFYDCVQGGFPIILD